MTLEQRADIAAAIMRISEVRIDSERTIEGGTCILQQIEERQRFAFIAERLGVSIVKRGGTIEILDRLLVTHLIHQRDAALIP
jgi:hypothetical protein